MNELMIQSNGKTMDSREIAELTGKRHDSVIRDIETQIGAIDGAAHRFVAGYADANNQQRKCYRLPYRETMILVSGYSVELRAKVIDRWMELERSNVPKSFAEALRLAADQAEMIEAQKEQIAIAAPKVESFEALQRSEQTMSITQAAKYFSLHPKTEVFPYLRDLGYLTTKDMPSQMALDSKVLSIRKNIGHDNKPHDQAVVLDCQLEKWRTVVVPNIKRWIAKD